MDFVLIHVSWVTSCCENSCEEHLCIGDSTETLLDRWQDCQYLFMILTLVCIYSVGDVHGSMSTNTFYMVTTRCGERSVQKD